MYYKRIACWFKKYFKTELSYWECNKREDKRKSKRRMIIVDDIEERD